MDNKDTASLETRLTDGSLYQRAPVHLRAQVLARTRDEAAREKHQHSQRTSSRNVWRLPVFAPWPFFGGAFAGAALSALVLGAMLWFQMAPRAPSDAPLAQEIVSSHVRALMSDRPIDVLSSDKHTVKPWFNGRIDYAPPVIDPAGPGFALVGGGSTISVIVLLRSLSTGISSIRSTSTCSLRKRRLQPHRRKARQSSPSPTTAMRLHAGITKA